MMNPPRLVPSDNARRLYSIRGVVEGYDVYESGWWIFKERVPIIRVSINSDQLAKFNNIVRNHMDTLNGPVNTIAPILQLGMTEAETKEYPVGSEIGITFGYANLADQFFTGATPLKVMKLQVMRPGVHLDNEVPA